RTFPSSRRSPNSRTTGSPGPSALPSRTARSPCCRPCQSGSREGKRLSGPCRRDVGTRFAARRALGETAVESFRPDGHDLSREQASAFLGEAGDLFEFLRQQQFGGLAVDEERAVQRGETPDEPFELGGPPAFQLCREIASVAPENAPRLLFALEELVDSSVWPHTRHELGQLRGTPFEREDDGDGIERQLAQAPQLAGQPGELPRKHGVDQRHEAVFLSIRYNRIERVVIGIGQGLR